MTHELRTTFGFWLKIKIEKSRITLKLERKNSFKNQSSTRFIYFSNVEYSHIYYLIVSS